MARLTDLAIENMKPSERRREIPDSAFPGLYLIVQPSGARSWALRFRVAGRPRKLTLGTFPALKLGAARKAAGLATEAVALGRDPATEKAAARLDRRDYLSVTREFLVRYAKPKNRSWRESARSVGLAEDPENRSDDPSTFVARKGGIADRWRARAVDEITGRDILIELDRIVDRGAAISANRTFAALRKFFRWCVQRRLIERSPCEGMRAPSPERSRDRVLSDDELRLIWFGAEKIGLPFGPLVKLLMLTLQRRDEVAEMRRDEVSDDMWTIAAARVKNGKQHDVPLSPLACDTMKLMPVIGRKDGFVFTVTGKTPVSGFAKAKERLDAAIDDLRRREAIERGTDLSDLKPMAPWVFHDLRRTGASGMARLGIALPIIERVLNHRSGSFAGVVGVYQRHEYLPERRAALDAWAAYVAALMDRKS